MCPRPVCSLVPTPWSRPLVRTTGVVAPGPCFHDLYVAIIGGSALAELPQAPSCIPPSRDKSASLPLCEIQKFLHLSEESAQELEVKGRRLGSNFSCLNLPGPALPCTGARSPTFRHVAFPHWGLPGNPGVLALEERSVNLAQRSS